jgi:hypothetical protein
MRRLPRLQNKLGQFTRQIKQWTPERWDEGYVDNRGRFRVYRPDCPRAWPSGYALRAHVVWWLDKGECHPKGYNLHHKDENRLNDCIENLELKTHAQHTRDHCFQEGIRYICQQCGIHFYVKQWRIDQRRREGQREIKYCSQTCYRKSPRSQETRQRMSASSKTQHCKRGHSVYA